MSINFIQFDLTELSTEVISEYKNRKQIHLTWLNIE